MKKLQVLAVLFFVMGTTNVFASEGFYAKPNNARSSKTVRNTPKQPKAKEQYLAAAQVRKIAKPKPTTNTNN